MRISENNTSIARICHTANREYCIIIGDNMVSGSWEEASSETKVSAIKGVEHIRQIVARGEVPDPAGSHESWLKQKTEDGWKYGEVKDEAKKEHPCFVPYDQLPAAQKVKDKLFIGVVTACLK